MIMQKISIITSFSKSRPVIWVGQQGGGRGAEWIHLAVNPYQRMADIVLSHFSGSEASASYRRLSIWEQREGKATSRLSFAFRALVAMQTWQTYHTYSRFITCVAPPTQHH